MGRESEVNGNVVGSVVKGSVIGEGVWALAAQPVDRRGGVSVQWGCAAGTSAKWRGTVPLCCWCVIRDKCEVERNGPVVLLVCYWFHLPVSKSSPPHPTRAASFNPTNPPTIAPAAKPKTAPSRRVLLRPTFLFVFRS